MSFNVLEALLLGMFLISASLLLICWFKFVFVLEEEKDNETVQVEEPAVSLIIAFKNEAENLPLLLEQLLTQQYSNFEVLLINDHSSDNSLAAIAKRSDPRIRVLNLAENERGKKQAIKYGIKNAKHELLLFTDADCLPQSSLWIKSMVKEFDSKTAIILGYSPYSKTKGLLNALIRFETFFNALQYAYFAVKAKAYMGVGRNLAYRKSLLKDARSFHLHENILGGDDDLTVNQLATKNNTRIQFQPEAHVYSRGKENWKDYWIQKRRHLQAGELYLFYDRLKLALIGFAQLIFTLTFMALIFSRLSLIVLLVFLLVYFIRWRWSRKIGKLMGIEDLVVWLPFLEMLYILWNLCVGVSTWILKVDKWK